MKVCVIQPYYSFDGADTQKCFDEMIALLDSCDDSLDLIVMPEYSDVPADQPSKEEFHKSIEKYNQTVMTKAREAAIRCNAIVFVNAADKSPNGYVNCTHAIDRKGNTVGKYYKAHPAPSEVKTAAQGGNELDVSYSYSFAKPYTVEIEGVKYGFMTCYDFYFYESFAALAREGVDVVIGCSHQRTDSHSALELINRFLCYNTNAYLIRSAVSLGEDSDICGCSCVIAPDSKVLVDMKSRIGLGICEIDPKKKYYKAAGFKGKEKSHYEYIEEGRRPWLYRNGGPGVVAFEDVMPYPRICAHRGFSVACPENTMPAFGAAVALGAEEIEFDIWSTLDGVLVSCHDPTLDRVSNGSGKIYEKTFDELKDLDFGSKHSESFAGLGICTFEEILQKFASRVVMNIHVKIWDAEFEDHKLEEIVALIRKYDCAKHCYFMTTSDKMLKMAMEYAPDIAVCVGWDGNEDKMSMVNRALALGIKKIQLFRPYFDQNTIDEAHKNGIICNLFWADSPDKALNYAKMGIDTILTNNYLAVSKVVRKYWKDKEK
ncbi:MAG: hypothetical protein E7646_04225 [Ruminococcaceae bacterium]|nr:hypothetical protein [Oscillospiraceae bacterium]